jgi:hypothetical protein
MKTLGFMVAIILAGATLLTLWGAILVAVTRPGAGSDTRASEVPFFFSAGAFGTIVVMGALMVVLRGIDKPRINKPK